MQTANARRHCRRAATLALGALLLAACAAPHDPRVTNTPNGTYDLSLPAYKAPAELTAAGRARVPVSKLTIAAPAAGARIMTINVIVEWGYSAVPVRWDYLLEADLAPRLREALDALFVIDPASPLTADILFRFDESTELKNGVWCNQYWEIVMTATMRIVFNGGGAPQAVDLAGADTDTYCQSLIGLPSGTALGASAGRAFDQMMRHAGQQDFTAATAQTAALPGGD